VAASRTLALGDVAGHDLQSNDATVLRGVDRSVKYRRQGNRSNDPVTIGSAETHHLHADRPARDATTVLEAHGFAENSVAARFGLALLYNPCAYMLPGFDVTRLPEPQLDLATARVREVRAPLAPQPDPNASTRPMPSGNQWGT
jgi:hypothetical protein